MYKECNKISSQYTTTGTDLCITRYPECTRMGRDTLNDLMEIQINGPSQVVNFCGDRALLHWLDNTKGQGTRHINGHSSPTC